MDNNKIIENLIELYGNDILRIANTYVKNPITAEDIFQEVFVKVNKNLSSFNKKSGEKTWLIRITINTCKDYLKSAWNKKVISIDSYSENLNVSENAEDRLLKSENSSAVVKEILDLPVKYREVIILYYYQAFSTKEISSILSVPEASVRTRMKRARELLKEKLQIILEI